MFAVIFTVLLKMWSKHNFSMKSHKIPKEGHHSEWPTLGEWHSFPKKVVLADDLTWCYCPKPHSAQDMISGSTVINILKILNPCLNSNPWKESASDLRPSTNLRKVDDGRAWNHLMFWRKKLNINFDWLIRP